MHGVIVSILVLMESSLRRAGAALEACCSVVSILVLMESSLRHDALYQLIREDYLFQSLF